MHKLNKSHPIDTFLKYNPRQPAFHTEDFFNLKSYLEIKMGKAQ